MFVIHVSRDTANVGFVAAQTPPWKDANWTDMNRGILFLSSFLCKRCCMKYASEVSAYHEEKNNEARRRDPTAIQHVTPVLEIKEGSTGNLFVEVLLCERQNRVVQMVGS